METPEHAPTIGEALRAALLAGEPVIAGRFADLHGFSRQGVAGALRTMEKRGLVHSEHVERANGGGTQLVVYTCINHAGMLARETVKQKFNPMIQLAAIAQDFSALLEVWGIRVVDIALPHVQHRMADDRMGAA